MSRILRDFFDTINRMLINLLSDRKLYDTLGEFFIMAVAPDVSKLRKNTGQRHAMPVYEPTVRQRGGGYVEIKENKLIDKEQHARRERKSRSRHADKAYVTREGNETDDAEAENVLIGRERDGGFWRREEGMVSAAHGRRTQRSERDQETEGDIEIILNELWHQTMHISVGPGEDENYVK